jgi:hypothetical protein
MKKQLKKSTPHKSANSAPVDNKQPETPQVDDKQQQTASPQAETVTPPVVSPAPVTPPPAASTPEKAKKETPKKEKAPSISAAVRRIVVKNPAVTASEVSQALIATGWDAGDVEKRTSTIATLRTDALSIIAIAKEEGCWK